MNTTLALMLLAAGPWDQGFEPSAVATYLDRQNASVVVITAGAATDSSRAAQAALVNALRTGGQTRLVMTAESIAVLPEDTDADLVKKANYLPVDLMIVVRLFSGAANSPDVAVATLYDKQGSATGAMAVTAGQSLPKREGVGRQSAGRAAVVEVVESAKEKSGSASQHREEQRRAEEPARDPRKITFEAGVMVNVRSGQIVSRWVQPYLAGRALRGVQFYETIGRADLVAKYRAANGLKIGLVLGGSVVLAAGGLLAIFTLSPPCVVFDARSSTCLQTQYPSLLVPGLVGGAVGLAALMAGLFINPNPVRPHELVELAEEYNSKVDGKAARPSKSTPVKVSAALLPTPNGVSASLSLQF